MAYDAYNLEGEEKYDAQAWGDCGALTDIDWRLPLLWMDLDRTDAVNMFDSRMRAKLAPAHTGLDRMLIQLGPSSGLIHELTYLRKNIQDALGSGIGDEDERETHAVWQTHVAQAANELIQERTEIRKEIGGAMRFLGGSRARLIREAFYGLEDAIAASSSDRLIAIREVQQQLEEIRLDSGPNCPAVILLVSAWLAWHVNKASPDIKTLLDTAVFMAGGKPTMSGSFAARLLALLHMENEDYADALNASGAAVKLRPSAESLMGMCKAFALRKMNAECVQALSSTIEKRPGIVVAILAEPKIMALGEPVAYAIVNYQLKARHEATAEIQAWSTRIRRVGEAERMASGMFRLPDSMTAGHSAKALEQAGILVCTHWADKAREAREDVVDAAIEALKRAKQERVKKVSQAQRGIMQSWESRENAVEAALRVQEAAALQSRNAVYSAMKESDRLQKGCFVSLGGGCALFGGYVAAALVLGTEALGGGLDSLLGKLAVAVAAIPGVACIVLQVVYGMKRMALDAKMTKAIQAATSNYHNSVTEADKIHEYEAERLREAVSHIEGELALIDSAIAFLGDTETPASAAA